MEPTPTPAEPAPVNQAKGKDDHSVFCPNCSNKLEQLKCKLLCKKCGYFMSCSDFY